MFQPKTMRRIQLQSNSRRKRRPLRIGLFIVYVLVQYITCAKIPEELTSTYPSSTDREENWTVESTLETFATTVDLEETVKESLSVESVAKETDEKNEGRNKEEEEEEAGEKQQQQQQQEEKGKEEKIKEEEKSKEAREKSKEESVGKAVAPKKEVTTILSKNVPRTTTVRLTLIFFFFFYYRI